MIRRGAVVPRPLYFNLGNPPLLLLPRRPQFQMRNYPFFGINGRPMYRVRSSIGPDGNGIANRFCPVSHFQRNRLVASGVYLAFAFSSRRLLYIDSYSRFLYRVDRERKDVSIVRKRYFFFFYEYLFFFYVLFYRGRWKLWNSRWKNVMCSVLSTSKRERRQEICGGDGGGNVTPRLHGPRQGDSNFRVHVGSVKRRAARFAST